MKWQILMQEEKYGKVTIPVQCKRLRFFPIEGKRKEITFGKLKFPLLQIIVQDEKGEILKLKLNVSEGIQSPRFVIQHPDGLDHPIIWIGEGRNRKQIRDTLAPMERVEGLKERYDCAKDMQKRLTQVCGVLLADEIMGLFAEKIGTLESKAA